MEEEGERRAALRVEVDAPKNGKKQNKVDIPKPPKVVEVGLLPLINIDEQNISIRLAGVPFTQLIKPVPQISCSPGLCLQYVRQTFQVGPKAPTATKGWEESQYRHENKKYPPDVWVPIWFSLSNNPAGHVALLEPDGSVWSASHPTQTQPVHHDSIEDMEKYFSNRLAYLGWTEDIEGVQVIGRVQAS